MKQRELIIRTAFGVVIIASAWSVFTSPLNRDFLFVSGGSVFLGVVLGLTAWVRLGHTLSLQKYPIPNLLLDLALLSQVTAASTQILVAMSLPSPFLALHNTPGMLAIYLGAAAGLASAAVWLVLKWGDAGRAWAALLGAGLFSSTLYLRSFSVPEAGPVYGAIFALAFLAGYSIQNRPLEVHFSFLRLKLTAWFGLSILSLAVAVLFSPALGQSLEYSLRLVGLAWLAALLAWQVNTRKAWLAAALMVAGIAGLVPILLGAIKLASLAPVFGLPAALAYRFHPTEMGGANLVARSVMAVAPLGLALASHWRASIRETGVTSQVSKLVLLAARSSGWLVLLGSAFVVFYSQSWGSIFAWLVSLGIYAVLVYWKDIHSSRVWPRTRLAQGSFAASLIVVSFAAGAGLLQTATRLNIYSFNGRLIHWYGAALALINHPITGAGPGYEAVYSPYANAIRLFVEAQTTTDAPLSVISIDAGRSLGVHSHNLILEIAAGSGFPGLITFLGCLAALWFGGLRILRSQNGAARLGAAACLAGIAGELAWGFQDVLWVTPPFLSFPIWGLTGLLLAAPRLSDPELPVPAAGNPTRAGGAGLDRFRLFLVGLGIFVVLLPSIASAQYSAGYQAFQERRWEEAQQRLETATHYTPYNAHLYAMLGQIYLELGEISTAVSSYERASRLEQDYSPYETKLGWLAWLQGDIEKAKLYFEGALDADPGEIWQDGLRSSLGLIYAADGRNEEAAEMFKTALQINPQLGASAYWQTTSSDLDGDQQGLEIILAPDYLGKPSPRLEKRIYNHLGVSDVSVRLFAGDGLETSPIHLSSILDKIETGYRNADSYQAPLLLAALAEASRRAGLEQRAEQAYVEFQSLQPYSAYGYRDLGILYREQGRLDEARSTLEQAVEVSPGDIASWYNLALVYLDQQDWVHAQDALDTITAQSLITLFRSRLFDPNLYAARARLLQGQGDLSGAAKELNKAIFVRQSPDDYFALANIYFGQGKPGLAAEQCVRAASVLLQNWTRPLDPGLWQAGDCLSRVGEFPDKVFDLSQQYPLSGNVLLGHAYRAGGQLDQARAAYQAAAKARPDQGAPHYFLGEIYQATGQTDLASDEYRQAITLNPLESLPLLALGRMQWAIGDRDAAVESFRAAVEATPGWDEAHIALANALFATNDLEAADAHYRLAHRLDGTISESDLYDFGSHIAGAEIQAPAPDYLRGDYFSIDGKRRRVLFMHPDSSAAFTITIPDEPDVKLSFGTGISPDAWVQNGDGVTFSIHVVSATERDTIFSAYIDPKNNLLDRRWHLHTLGMSDYQGQTLQVIFETNGGPDGDESFDWAGWAEPKLVR